MGMGQRYEARPVETFTLQPGQCLEVLRWEASTPWEVVEPQTYSLQPVEAHRERKRQHETSAVTSDSASVTPGAARRESQDHCKRQEQR